MRKNFLNSPRRFVYFIFLYIYFAFIVYVASICCQYEFVEFSGEKRLRSKETRARRAWTGRVERKLRRVEKGGEGKKERR